LFSLPNICTHQQALELASSYLEEKRVFFGHGTDNSWDEAVALLLWAASLPANVDPSILNEEVLPSVLKQFVDAMNTRVDQRKPAAYITQQAWFFGLSFYINESVLVPRSPIAELIANRYHPWLIKSPKRILDLCCGSGCIGIAAAMAQEEARVLVSDLSKEAIAVANKNIQLHDCADRVQSVCANLFDGIKSQGKEGQLFDLILCNPPYVDKNDLDTMPAEYHHEPEMGLSSGDDGLDLTRQILSEAAEYLTEDGVLILEVGNSWQHMEKVYPEFSFIWLEFEYGGLGVCVLTKTHLMEPCFRQ